MNAVQLLEAMKNGATVESRWKSRSFAEKARYQYILTIPGQSPIVIQKSLVDALIKAGSVRSVYGFGANRTYEVIE